MRTAPEPSSRPDRRAFALPLVILLTLIVSLAVGVLMQRSSVGTLAARRQADGYISHHAGLGMREMVSRWLTTVRGRLAESIESDGFAFSLEIPSGERIDVFLDDAQGSVLQRTDSLMGRRREIVEMMNAYLDLFEQQEAAAAEARRGGLSGPGVKVVNRVRHSREARVRAAPGSALAANPDAIPRRRMHGPSEISIKTAPREVIEALASAVVDPKKAAEVAESLIQRRDDQSTDRTMAVDEVTRTLREVGLEDEELNEISAMLVYVPTLYRVTAELKDPGGRLIDKAQGLMLVAEGQNDPFNQNGPFLTWETVPLEDSDASR